MDILISFIVVVLSQCTCISRQWVVDLNYIEFLFVYYLNNEKKKKESMSKVLSINLVYSRNGNHSCKTKHPWALTVKLFLQNFRIQNIIAFLRSACVRLSKHTNPEDPLFKKGNKNDSKHIKLEPWNADISKSQRRMPGIQEAKISVEHTLGSAGRYIVLGGWKREGFPMTVTEWVRQGLRDRDEISSVNISLNVIPGFLDTIFKNQLLLNYS